MSSTQIAQTRAQRKPLHRKAGRALARIVTIAQSHFGIGEEGRFRYLVDDSQQRHWDFEFVARRNRQRVARLRIHRGAKRKATLWVRRDFARQPRRSPGELFTIVTAILHAHREPIFCGV